jgi:drug/metabolite transporter (DMT)-like permease
VRDNNWSWRMKPSPIFTTIAAVFLAAAGVFFVYMSATHPHSDARVGSLVTGIVLLVLAALGFWRAIRDG